MKYSVSLFKITFDCVGCGRNKFLYGHFFRLTMAERPVITPAMLSQEKPLVKIGHYALGETLGVGTFGKVKSKLFYILSQIDS